MSLTESKEPKLGEACPDFNLSSVDLEDKKKYSLEDFKNSKALLIAFICRHCPYVIAIEDRLIELGKSFKKSELEIIAICSNDFESYPEDAPVSLYARALEKDYKFPYLIDETQAVAKQFDAQCTPDLFLYDQDRKLYYHGQLDDSWKDANAVSKEHMKEAVEGVLENKPAPQNQKPSIGCSIKWK